MSFSSSFGRYLFAMMGACMIALSAQGEDSINTPYPVTSTRDTLVAGDSIIVIHTVCAPVCSSCARVYNKEWSLIRTIVPPIQTPFPEAYIQDGKLLWRDNLPQMLDDSERRLDEETTTTH